MSRTTAFLSSTETSARGVRDRLVKIYQWRRDREAAMQFSDAYSQIAKPYKNIDCALKRNYIEQVEFVNSVIKCAAIT